MGLSNQVKNMKTSADRRSTIFKDGVNIRAMKGKDPIVFRVLPAFDPNNDAKTSCVTYIGPDGNLTDWGMVLYMSRYVGHGRGKFGSRQDILSLRTFAEGEDAKVLCPLEHLATTIKENSDDWGYLMEDHGEGKNRVSAAFKSPMNCFITNVWDSNQPTKGVQIGIFSSSGCDSLIGTKTGLVFQRNNLPEDIVAQNFLLAYAVGDLTSPSDGPMLICRKDDSQGDFSKYVVSLALDNANSVIKRPISQDLLEQRYNMSKPDTFLNIPTEETSVQTLVQLLNSRSPSGYHEHALLKLAFPQFQIPDPPSASATPNTITAGFGANPAAGNDNIPMAAAPAVKAEANGVIANMQAAAPAPTAPVVAPVAPAPGDAVKFDREKFLSHLSEQSASPKV